MRNKVGTVGLSIQFIQDEKNHCPKKQIYVCIGNGKKNLAFFKKNLKELKQFIHEQFNEDTFFIEGSEIRSFFLADLKHIWENSFISGEEEIPHSPPIIIQQFQLPINSFSISELNNILESDRLEQSLTSIYDSQLQININNYCEENQIDVNENSDEINEISLINNDWIISSESDQDFSPIDEEESESSEEESEEEPTDSDDLYSSDELSPESDDEGNFDEGTFEDHNIINEDDELGQKCPFCGKDLCGLREYTCRESKELNLPKHKIVIKHWIGIQVKYFCILHASQRCMERILFYFGGNDQKKVREIRNELVRYKLVRSSWNFRDYNNRLYPQMIFGDEVRKILNNIYKWTKNISWITDQNIKILRYWRSVHRMLHLKSEEIKSYNSNFSSIRQLIDKFINLMISNFGKEIIQYYFHFIDFHFIEILREGISLCLYQQQGVEHSHSLHKQIQRSMSSNEAGAHKTPSSHQILLRQLRIMVLENKIFDDEIQIDNEWLIDNMIESDLFEFQ